MNTLKTVLLGKTVFERHVERQKKRNNLMEELITEDE